VGSKETAFIRNVGMKMGMMKNVNNPHPKDLNKSPAATGFFVSLIHFKRVIIIELRLGMQ